MNERDKRRVGEQIEPGGRPKAPGRLELLQRFLNTWNHEFPVEWDRIGTPEKAERWLTRKGLLAAGSRVSVADVRRLQELREAIRALARTDAHGGPAVQTLQRLHRERGIALRVEIDRGGRTALVPAAPGVEGAIASLLAILHEAQITGAWTRMKGCRQCGYAFYDRSKNRSGAWCAMAICGNRTKNRAYRRRKVGVSLPVERSDRRRPGGTRS